MLRLRIILTLIAIACSAGVAWSDVTVKVTGSGATRTAALEDATRLAVQLAMEQLVVTDRKIVNDEIVRDETISTLNGFIKKRKILATRKSAGEVEIDALITVSERQVTNYIGDISPGNKKQNGTPIDGSTLGSELERQRNARNAGASAILRMFRGFPLNSVDVKIQSTRLSERSSDKLEVVYTIQFSEPFRRQLESTVAALSTKKIKVSGGSGYRLRDQPNSWSRSPFDWWASGPIPDYEQKTKYSSSFYICFQNNTTGVCYFLQDKFQVGIKYRDQELYSPTVLVAFKGVRRDGQNLFCRASVPYFVTKSQVYEKPTIPVRPFSGTPGTSTGLLIGFDRAFLVSEVDVSGLDLSELEELVPFVGIATYRGYPAGFSGSVDDLVIHDVSSGELNSLCGD
jgi:hypothetical protein